jgi:hypothetical protein
METYINNGSKDGKKSYLVVGGKRVYTGQEFEAEKNDVGILSQNFDVTLKASKPAKKKAETETKAVESVQPKSEKKTNSDFNTLKITNSDKGVK